MLLAVGILLMLVSVSGVLYMNFNPQFGGKIRKKDLLRYEQSENWRNGKFVNLISTGMNVSLSTLPGILKKQFFERKGKTPAAPIPVIPFNNERFESDPDIPKFVWYGHSVVLLQLKGKNFLIDPMFGKDASPIAPFSAARFSKDTLAIIDSLPKIDAVLMSHDHYDHLDYPSILKLKGKVDKFLVSLGVGRHLEAWGIEEGQISEFDWWDSKTVEGIKITFTPSRHFSGRGLNDRAKVLWGGWVFKSEDHSIYFSGDGGYGPHFSEVGEKLGPFDIGFMECGQYDKNWHDIHMYPEEAVQASVDARVKNAIPVHWGAFALSLHKWKDPVERFCAEADKKQLPYLTPRIGEVVRTDNMDRNYSWWKELK